MTPMTPAKAARIAKLAAKIRADLEKLETLIGGYEVDDQGTSDCTMAQQAMDEIIKRAEQVGGGR